MEPLRILRDVYGYDRFRGNQEAIIQHVVDGGDAMVVMPTGSGKSLCYQIPALLRKGVGIVISPLIALMQDQVMALRQLDVRAAALHSQMDLTELRALEYQVASGHIDLLYVAPERATTTRFLEFLEKLPLALVAIDEAHCVSQWGHEFRPEYLKLNVLHERFPQVPRIALTATADAATRRDMVHRLKMERAKLFMGGFDRPNIRYTVVTRQDGRKQLLQFLASRPRHESGIVYCLSRKKTEQVAAFLKQHGYRTVPYHAGLDAEVRSRNQERFRQESSLIVVATIAFGMGIDKPDVRFVAHLDLPKSIEAYYQETGRAGRDGLPAEAWMAYGLADVVLLRSRMAQSAAEERFKQIERRKLDALLGFCETVRCRRQVLLEYFDDKLDAPCGNCDTCLQPVSTWDASVAAQKALSAVYRTGGRYGAKHVVDVLTGVASDKVVQRHHHELKTFGVGKELSAEVWHSVLRQLTAHGILSVDTEGYGRLRLTDRSAPVLKGEQRIVLRSDTAPRRSTPRAGRGSQPMVEGPAGDPRTAAAQGPTDIDLFEKLRTVRMELARKHGVPPYVVFHDLTLREMANVKPLDRATLRTIPGVGAAKLERYGDSFIQAIRDYVGRAGTEVPLDTLIDALVRTLSNAPLVRASIPEAADSLVPGVARGRWLEVLDAMLYEGLLDIDAQGRVVVKQ